ncbi:hypothetical protein NDN08_000806 [Rhodosorus marinus]|uniref:Uncharacterized protein n=1 Tax=Rhodosorus marinus TaxID=101924 RepID=A0AAV8UT96_9RHOD|nr:hypothetical protein NDN08_000806 [Rhodosorus marinus]
MEDLAFVAGVRCQMVNATSRSATMISPRIVPAELKNFITLDTSTMAEGFGKMKPMRYSAWLDGWVCGEHSAGPLRRSPAPVFKRRWSGWLPDNKERA